jgi:dipeptidyl aminopeptidase/acylaminoacyl peptidase
VLTAVLFFSLASTYAQSRRIEVEDFAKVVTVSDPQISPDGKSIVCRVSRWNMQEDRTDRQLVLVDIASTALRELTYERKGVSSPRWSPDGDRIAFLADDGSGKDEKAQIFVLPMSGGDARKITESATPVEQFAWRPDGEQIAYVAADEAPNKEDVEHHIDAFEVGDNDFLQTKAPTSSHIWLVAVNGGKARRLTSGSWSLPKMMPPSPPSSPISWSVEGKLLAFTRQEDPHSGHWEEQTVQILNVETGEIRKLTDHKVMEQYGLFSPDGSQVAYVYPREGLRLNNNEVYVTRAAGGGGQNLSRALDRNIVRVVWMADGKSLLLGGHDGTQTALWLQPLNGQAKKLALGEVNPPWASWVDVSVGKKGDIAFPGTSTEHASELYYMASANDVPRKLTDFNSEIAGRSLGKAERIEWKGPDGFLEDGVLLYPPDFRKDRKYPLVLIHGGPGSASTTQFDFLGQLMVARDVVVFEPNYRGSENLGNAYRHAIWNDAGDGPGRDVMAGTEAVKKLGFVDESRIAVSGWSYGGYMTS